MDFWSAFGVNRTKEKGRWQRSIIQLMISVSAQEEDNTRLEYDPIRDYRQLSDAGCVRGSHLHPYLLILWKFCSLSLPLWSRPKQYRVSCSSSPSPPSPSPSPSPHAYFIRAHWIESKRFDRGRYCDLFLNNTSFMTSHFLRICNPLSFVDVWQPWSQHLIADQYLSLLLKMMPNGKDKSTVERAVMLLVPAMSMKLADGMFFSYKKFNKPNYEI